MGLLSRARVSPNSDEVGLYHTWLLWANEASASPDFAEIHPRAWRQSIAVERYCHWRATLKETRRWAYPNDHKTSRPRRWCGWHRSQQP